MLKASLRHLQARAESLLAIAGFAASSLFWLVLAFLMPAGEYGSMMTVQAPVLLVVAVFTFRTHDLVYYLTSQRGFAIERSWRVAVTIEAVGAILCWGVSILSVRAFYPSLFFKSPDWQLALFAFLASLTVIQGASIAMLRHGASARPIIWANVGCIVAWLGVAVALLAFPSRLPMLMLIIASVPQGVRTVILLVFSSFAGERPEGLPRPVSRRQVTRFLASGQMVNFVKNGATSLETMVLSAFAPPQVIAMYRLAKSSLGVATAASNIAVQQGFFSIAKATAGAGKLRQVRLLNIRLIRICAANYPLAVAFAFIYSFYKPEIDFVTFEAITFGVFLASVPSVLLQTPFVVASLEGKIGIANTAYILSLVVFLGVSALLFVVPSVWLFLVATLVSALARQVYLSSRVRGLLAKPSEAGADRGPPAPALNS
jgi:hypothetical protein